MVGRALNHMPRAPAMTAHGRAQAAVGQLDPLDVLRHQIRAPREVDQLVEPLRENHGALRALKFDPARDAITLAFIADSSESACNASRKTTSALPASIST